MKLRKEKLYKMDRVPCNINFVNKNTNTSQNIFDAQYKTALHRVNEEARVEKAEMKREQIREEKVQKIHFDSIKWELYRQRVELIEDDYAEFKRRQKKIQWWLDFIMRDHAIRKAR